MPRGRARSKSRLLRKSDFRPLNTLSNSAETEVITVLAERVHSLSLPLFSSCRGECCSLSSHSLSPLSHTACGSAFSAYALTSCFPCTMHLWSGQHCVCLSSELDTKRDKYMKLSCFPTTLCWRLTIHWGSYPNPRLGHRMVTFRSEEGHWSLDNAIGAAVALDQVKVQPVLPVVTNATFTNNRRVEIFQPSEF